MTTQQEPAEEQIGTFGVSFTVPQDEAAREREIAEVSETVSAMLAIIAKSFVGKRVTVTIGETT